MVISLKNQFLAYYKEAHPVMKFLVWWVALGLIVGFGQLADYLAARLPI